MFKNLGFKIINLFCCKFTYSFCKLDLFIAMQQILLMVIKWSNLQKSLSKFTPKKFYEIDSWIVFKFSQTYIKKCKILRIPYLSLLLL